MSSLRAAVEQRTDARGNQPKAAVLAHDEDRQSAVVELFPLAWSGDVEPVIIVAHEQQWRLDAGLLIVDRQASAGGV